jgi:transcriptional regulator with XRE-family HTH domain
MSRSPSKPDETTYAGRFAARLKTLRENTGLTAQEFGDNLYFEGRKIPLNTYYNWESGRYPPPLNALPVLADALKLKSVRSLMPEK